MPEEERTEWESNGKLVKEIYIDSEMMDKFWIEDSKTYYGKPEKGMLGTLIFNDCCDERVILLMGSDCGTEDLMMEGEVLSEASDAISFDYEPITQSMVLREKLNGGDLDAKLLSGNDQQEENKFSEVNLFPSSFHELRIFISNHLFLFIESLFTHAHGKRKQNRKLAERETYLQSVVG